MLSGLSDSRGAEDAYSVDMARDLDLVVVILVVEPEWIHSITILMGHPLTSEIG